MKYVVFGAAIFLITFSIANAQVVINEVQISPTGERFIELYNIGDSDIDLTDWYIQRKTATGSSFGSLVTSPNFENKIIKASGYFLISRSSIAGADIILDTMTLTEFNTVRLRDSKREDVDYIELGNINEEESYQRMLSGEWITASPTPGSANLNSNDGSVNNSESNSDSEDESSQSQPSSSSSASSSSFPVDPQIFASAGGDRIVIVGADSLFEGKAVGLQKQPLEGARYVWNFGNGETKEGQNVLHYYGYPGEYVVILNVSSGEYSASDRMVVNAYPAELALSKVESGFIEVHNKSNQELNLSWWQLESQGERFIIPRDTIVLSNKKLIFSSSVTGLDTSVKESVSLLYPNGVEAVSFFQIVIPQKVVVAKKTVTKPQPVIIEKEESILEEQKEVIKNTKQAASVISSFGERGEGSGVYKWLLAIFGVIGISAGIIVYASGKRELGDDIEIVE
jgi:hypothetical protein